MHDGAPVRGAARSWRMLYLDPATPARALLEDLPGETEIARPVLQDPLLATWFAHAFAHLIAAVPDALAAEEATLRRLALLLARHGSRHLPVAGPPPPVGLALRHLSAASERSSTA